MNTKILIAGVVALLAAWVWPRQVKTEQVVPGFAFFPASLSIIPSFSQSSYQVEVEIVNRDNSKTNLDALFQKYAGQTGVPWQLLKAIAMAESSLNPDAINEEGDGVGGRASRGLMQILAPQRLNVNGWTGDGPTGGVESLFDPDVNIHIGSQIIRWNMETYGFYRGIAIYNNWSQRHQSAAGPFSNQYYVDRIVGYFKAYGGDESATLSKYGAGRKG